MSTRTRSAGHRTRPGQGLVRSIPVTLLAVVCLTPACGLLQRPDPGPSPGSTLPAGSTPAPGSTPAVSGPPPTEFAPLDAAATGGLDTGANDFALGFAVAGDTVVSAGTVYGDRLAPSFRYSTDAGASWQLGRLSDASAAATPPDQGDQSGHVAVATVRGATRWVVLGGSWRQTLTWTSADGRVWDRHAPPASQIAPEATVSAIAATSEGFVMVGTDAKGAPAAWTSPDGTTWQQHRMRGAGDPASVAVRGSTVVAVGSADDAYAAWSSSDSGRTWSRSKAVPKPGDDGDFSRYLTSVAASPRGFTAIGSYWADDWRPVAYESRNGRTWRVTASGDDLTTATVSSSTGDLVAAVEGETLAVTQETEPGYRPHLWTARGGAWREARTPLDSRGQVDRGDWSIGGVVRGGDTWTVSALLSRNGQIVVEFWRSTDGGQTFAAVDRPDAELNRPVTYPSALVRAADETVVLGDSRRRPVLWTRKGTEPFGPARLISADSAHRVAGGAAHGTDVVAYGGYVADGVDYAVVWRRQGTRWTATDRSEFSDAKSSYASSSINQVAWLRNRWVLVGQTSDNGDRNDSALIATSTDGLSWRKARPARTFAEADGEGYDVTDLQGDGERRRAAYGVTQVAGRLLAVGDSAEGAAADGKGTTATVWTSADARTWTMKRLPLRGWWASSMREVVVRGSTVVVVGTGTPREGAPARLAVWRSTDGGRSWQQQLMAPTLGTGSGDYRLVSLAGGFALIADEVEGTSFPVLMLSADGVSWRERSLSSLDRKLGEGVVVGGAVADGDDLWLLARAVNRFGAGTRLVGEPTR